MCLLLIFSYVPGDIIPRAPCRRMRLSKTSIQSKIALDISTCGLHFAHVEQLDLRPDPEGSTIALSNASPIVPSECASPDARMRWLNVNNAVLGWIHLVVVTSR